ncbi:hypothetical protein FGE12_21620 [Aggregicoccus sp. 17bor-14]|uniref:right-handed parallel beta-helix repeat-containing protein n=1 Tax=Myxococcaceae TaxID=31 RepID=UPI00129D20CB|nr:MULTISPECIES: right-handed parallel beta-helix repeat-containing protein [Myxococcaceae]MBF5045016.1 hypothetical protein [Simulacricoccus sp. 17bor-14]MRI90759.1 hypothetical protein [Aggregicoccus sp. 17bor-14]
MSLPSCRTVLCCAALLVLAACEPDFPGPGSPGYFRVDTLVDGADPTPGDGLCGVGARGSCTLRAAVMESNARPGPNTIEVPAGTFTLRASGSGDAERGDLDVHGSIRVLGAGMNATLIDAGPIFDRHFELHDGRLELLDLTLRHGQGEGAAVAVNAGLLLLRRVAVRDNTADFSGGALRNRGVATLEDCLFDGNAGPRVGAVANLATMGVERCTFSHNTSGATGAITNEGGLTLSNSTVSGNKANSGTGGITNLGPASLTLVNVTITDNEAGSDDTDRAGGLANNGVARLSNTLIAGNRNRFGGQVDCAGTLTSGGYNLVQNPGTECKLVGDLTGNLLGSVAELGPLQDNGGPTPTHLLAARSPGRDAANPAAPGSSATACRTVDQRGVARPQSGRCDMGATEQ